MYIYNMLVCNNKITKSNAEQKKIYSTIIIKTERKISFKKSKISKLCQQKCKNQQNLIKNFHFAFLAENKKIVYKLYRLKKNQNK